MQKQNIEDLKKLINEKSKTKIEEKALSAIEEQNSGQKNEIEKYKRQMDSQIEKIEKNSRNQLH